MSQLSTSQRTRPAALRVAAVAMVAAAVVALVAPSPALVDARVAVLALEAAAAVVAVLAGLLLTLQSRLTRSFTVASAGMAVLVLGVITFAVTALVPATVEVATAGGVLAWLRPASRLSVMVLLAYALVGRRRREYRSLATLAGHSLAVVAAVTVALQLLPGAARVVASAADPLPALADSPVGGSVLLAAGWAALAAGYALAAVRRPQPLLGWVALALLGLGAGEAQRAITAAAQTGPQAATVWSVNASALTVAGLACLLGGAAGSLWRRLFDVHGEFAGLLTRAQGAEAQARHAETLHRQHVHEARNALGGIVNSLRLLEEHRDRLDQEAQRGLAAAALAELLRLQHTLDSDQAQQPAPFVVLEALAPVATAARSQGLDVDIAVPEQLTAHGSWVHTAQAVQNLLENARRHAPGSPVCLRATADGDVVTITVDDEGPGVPAADRERIFEQGQRGPDTVDVPGSGLGLGISRTLLREQGGDLWVTDSPAGGARFVATLPATAHDHPGSPPAAPPATSQPLAFAQLVDQAQDVGQPAHGQRLRRLVGDQIGRLRDCRPRRQQ